MQRLCKFNVRLLLLFARRAVQFLSAVLLEKDLDPVLFNTTAYIWTLISLSDLSMLITLHP